MHMKCLYQNCRDNTAGFTCDECLPGYDRDDRTDLNGACYRGDQPCTCDPNGSQSDVCISGACQCKVRCI